MMAERRLAEFKVRNQIKRYRSSTPKIKSLNFRKRKTFTFGSAKNAFLEGKDNKN